MHVSGMLLFGEWENGQRVATVKTFKIDKDEEEYQQEHTAVLLENPYAKVNTLNTVVCLKINHIHNTPSRNVPQLLINYP